MITCMGGSKTILCAMINYVFCILDEEACQEAAAATAAGTAAAGSGTEQALITRHR